MLETVKSRRIYGFLILTVLPASFAAGFYLKHRKDEKTETLTSLHTPAKISSVAIEDRIRMLRRQTAELDRERKEVLHKLARIREREAGEK